MHLVREESSCKNLKEDYCCLEPEKKLIVLSTSLTDFCLQLAVYSFVSLFLDSREQAMCSVGFCVINTLKRCYPLEDATHIALRKCVGKQHKLDGSRSLTSDRLLLKWGNLFLGVRGSLEPVKRQGIP